MADYKFKIGDRVSYRFDKNVGKGTIVNLTSLGVITEGDCEEEDENHPWYEVKWDLWEDGQIDRCPNTEESTVGAECEDSLVLIPKIVS